MPRCETVKVKTEDGYMIINKSDIVKKDYKLHKEKPKKDKEVKPNG